MGREVGREVVWEVGEAREGGRRDGGGGGGEGRGVRREGWGGWGGELEGGVEVSGREVKVPESSKVARQPRGDPGSPSGPCPGGSTCRSATQLPARGKRGCATADRDRSDTRPPMHVSSSGESAPSSRTLMGTRCSDRNSDFFTSRLAALSR